MPPATQTVARDEILSRFKAAIAASSYSSIQIEYDDVTGDMAGEAQSGDPEPIPPVEPWIRASVRHDPSGGFAATLGTANGKRRRTMVGTMVAQVFTPFGDGQKDSDAICEVVLDAFRTGGDTPSGVQFRSARSVEVGKSGVWFQVNCLVDFEYDLIR